MYLSHLLILIPLLGIVLSNSFNVRSDFAKKNLETCKRIGREPFFDIDVVVGKPWRVYYTWNLKLDTKCMDMTFRNATTAIVKRIWTEMSDYLEQQPAWQAATMLLTMGPSKHELLLFADQGPAGSFIAVPNIARTTNLLNSRKSVALLKFQLKLLNEGQYLLFMDCQVGTASLGVRPGRLPYRSEIAVTADKLGLGDGFPACIKERNKDEEFVIL